MGFLVFLLVLITLDVAWWVWADRRVRPLPHAPLWRIMTGAFMALQLGGFFWIMGSRMAGSDSGIPLSLLGLIYIWHVFVLPASWLMLLSGKLIAILIRAGRWIRAAAWPPPVGSAERVSPSAGLTRRQVLLSAAAVVPPLLTVGTARGALARLDEFRIRPLTVAIPDLPVKLDGLTIAHVTDSHVGRFTFGQTLQTIADRTNQLDPDLIVFTGDLIDYSLRDLPEALEMLHRFRARHGLFVCEGNHDLFDDAREFERRVQESGIRLLLNDGEIVRVRGEVVQMLGLKWGDRGSTRRPEIEQNMKRLLPAVRTDAFPILLAHHPHAFDEAAKANLPLTLTGHTHGGQLMLTENVGTGSVLFKYLSGLYQQGPSSLVVANGVGHWFPLRINAPTEVIHLTLRRATGLIPCAWK